MANYDGNYIYGDALKGIFRNQTVKVGSFPANPFGLYDMHGNVWEWCLDDWHGNYKGATTDGRAWVNNKNNNYFKMVRGGSWYYDPEYCRSAFRDSNDRAER